MISDKLKKISEDLSSLTVVEAAELSRFLEEHWGVTAAAAPAAASAGVSAESAKDSFDIFLTDAGEKKIDVIKVVRSITGLGLVEAKAMVDGAAGTAGGALVKSEGPTAECQKIIDDITAAGGKVIKK